MYMVQTIPTYLNVDLVTKAVSHHPGLTTTPLDGLPCKEIATEVPRKKKSKVENASTHVTFSDYMTTTSKERMRYLYSIF